MNEDDRVGNQTVSRTEGKLIFTRYVKLIEAHYLRKLALFFRLSGLFAQTCRYKSD